MAIDREQFSEASKAIERWADWAACALGEKWDRSKADWWVSPYSYLRMIHHEISRDRFQLTTEARESLAGVADLPLPSYRHPSVGVRSYASAHVMVVNLCHKICSVFLM